MSNEKMLSLEKFQWLGYLLCFIQVFTSYNPVSSSINIENFLQKESDMITKIQDYLVQERDRLDKSRQYQLEWKEWRHSNTNQESEYITIPQNLFHLFKRVTRDFEELESIMTKKFNIATGDIQPPTEDHLKGVILSLVDLQNQYDLKIEDITNGTLMDLRLNESLSLNLCFLLAKTCAEYNNHRCTIDWLQSCFPSTTDVELAIKFWKLTYPSYIFLNQYEKAFEHAKFHTLYELNTPALDTYMELGLQLGKLNDEDNATLEAKRLCREHLTNPTHANLKCKYNHENTAFLKIAPLKEEELYHYPKVLLYRDMLSDSEIEIIKNEAAKILQPAELATAAGSSATGFTYRISENAFLDRELSDLAQLDKRLEDISELSLRPSEWLQALNYAPGGFYILHNDYLPEVCTTCKVEDDGNRITSIMFYFNEITQGGETVFPRIGVSVKPAKGLALVWHSVHSDGSKNLLTDHSACPVVIGEKWGFTKWIRGRDQKCLRKIYEHEPVIPYETAINSTQFLMEEKEPRD